MESCKLCGQCCRFIALPLPPDMSDDLKRWLSLHGCEFEFEFKFEKLKEFTWVKFPVVCQMLGKNNECRCYDIRPNVCRNFPFSKNELHFIEGCGYG